MSWKLTINSLKAMLITSGVLFSLPSIGKQELTNSLEAPADKFLPMIIGLIVILVIIFFLALLMKKISSFNLLSNNIKVIESQSLGAKEKLVIVEIQNQQFVLGVTQNSINKICELKQNINKKEINIPFEQMMKKLINPNKNKPNKNGATTKKVS